MERVQDATAGFNGTGVRQCRCSSKKTQSLHTAVIFDRFYNHVTTFIVCKFNWQIITYATPLSKDIVAPLKYRDKEGSTICWGSKHRITVRIMFPLSG